MRGEITILLGTQWRAWRNAWRPDSQQRGQRIGSVVAIPLFIVGLFVATRYFLDHSGLLEILALGEVWSNAYQAATALTTEALSMSTTTTFTIICLGALDQAYESFFLAPDLPLLLSAPVSRRAIFVYKLLMNMRWDTTMVLVTAMPIWLAFAIWLGASPIFYLALVIGWGLLLLFVSGMGIVLAMVLARFISSARLRQIMLSFVLSIGLLIVVLVQGLVTGVWNREGLAGLLGVQFLTRQSWLPSVWLTKGLVALTVGTMNPWPWLLGLAGSTVVALLAACRAAERLYGEGWSQVQVAEEAAPRRGRREGPPKRPISASWALVQKDLRLFFRQPMQWYQAALGIIVMVMVLLNFAGQERPAPSAYMIALVMGYVGASTFAMNLGLRGISREGLCWWILQVSPLSERQMLHAKLLTALVPTGIYAGLALVGMHVALGLPWMVTLASLPVLLCMTGGMIAMDVAIGIWRADLQRASETRNADVPAVLVSQLANYAFLSPGLFLLSLPPLLGQLEIHLDLGTMLLASATVFVPLSALAALLANRYSLTALRAMRLAEPMPSLRMLL